MQIDIITLFPEIALAPLRESIIKRAQDNNLVTINAHDLRQWATGKHKKTDDYLCGGGPGMLLKPEPIFAAIRELRQPDTQVILLTPQGQILKQSLARQLSTAPHLILLCGHYEGVDHRVIENLVDLELSIGDYILTNGALAAAVLTDSLVRLLPGALGDSRSPLQESFSDPNLLEAPAYTKPTDFEGLQVPEVFLNGNHAEMEKWRAHHARQRTQQNRPDLLPPEA